MIRKIIYFLIVTVIYIIISERAFKKLKFIIEEESIKVYPIKSRIIKYRIIYDIFIVLYLGLCWGVLY